MGLFGSIGGIIGSAIGGPWGGAIGSVGGSLLDRNEARKSAENEYQNQKEFAQYGVRWKVADAKAAGIHPLYALGANTASYTPVSVMQDDLGGMGQDISRAIHATRTESERQEAIAEAKAVAARREQREQEMHDAELTERQNRASGQFLENQILANQLAKLSQTPTPAFPYVATPPSSSGQVEVVPHQIVSSSTSDPSVAAGHPPGWVSYKVAPNFNLDLPGQQMSESLESTGVLQGPLFAGLSAVRGTMNAIDRYKNPPLPESLKRQKLPPNYVWDFDSKSRTWKPARIDWKYQPVSGGTRAWMHAK